MPTWICSAGARDSEKSNRISWSRCLPERTPMLSGLMSRWATPCRSSEATAWSRSSPNRWSSSRPSRPSLRSRSASVSLARLVEHQDRPAADLADLVQADDELAADLPERLGLLAEPGVVLGLAGDLEHELLVAPPDQQRDRRTSPGRAPARPRSPPPGGRPAGPRPGRRRACVPGSVSSSSTSSSSLRKSDAVATRRSTSGSVLQRISSSSSGPAPSMPRQQWSAAWPVQDA